MKGIYLNDIPVDLFMEYFTKEDLATKNLEPVMEDFEAVIYTHTFTIPTDPITNCEINLHFDSLSNIEYCFSKLFQDQYNYSDITLGTIIGPTTETLQLYYNSELDLIYPYEKYLIKEDTKEIFYCINIETEPTIKIKNAITEEYIFSAVTIDNDGIVRFGEDIVARIYINEKYKVQKKDIPTQYPLFKNEIGEETTANSRSSIFQDHNTMFRNGFYSLKPLDYIKFKFNPSCIGITNIPLEKDSDGLFKENLKLAYFEKYIRTETYTILDVLPEPEPTIESEVIDPEIIAELNSLNPKTKSTETEIYKFNEILNISNLPRVSVVDPETIPSNFEFTPINRVDNIESLTNILLDLYDYKITLLGVDYFFDNITNSVYISSLDKTLDIITANNSIFVRLPITITQANIDIGLTPPIQMSVNIPYKTGVVTQTIFSNGTLSTMIFTINDEKYTVKGLSGLDPIYDDGFILVNAEIINLYKRTLFGTINSNNSTSTSIILNKYSAPVQEPLYSLDETVKYYKDSITNTVIEKKIEFDIISTTDYDINEFINYTHEEVAQIDADFSIYKDGIEKYIARVDEITTPLEFQEFISNFSNFAHYYYRNDIVGSGLFRSQYAAMINNMIQEFMDKRYDNFLIVDNLIFDNDAPMKMRIYAEGYKNLVENNLSFMSVFERSRTKQYEIEELDDKIILEEVEPFTSDLKIKEYAIPNLSIKTRSDANTFQKIRDYMKFPYNKVEEQFLANQELREKIYNDKTGSRNARDDINLYNKEYQQNMPTRISFKETLIRDLVDNFYYYNVYSYKPNNGITINNNKFTSNYEKFYKSKLDSLEPKYINSLSSNIKKKYTFYKEEEEPKENDLLEKILVEDWRVL